MDTIQPLATPAYIPLDPNAPVGTQDPASFAASALNNIRALRDAIIIGAMQGWTYAPNPTNSNRPTARAWASGAFRLSMNFAYPGGTPNLPSSCTFYWSNDSGGSYVQIGAVANITWDTALINITAVSDNGGLWIQWLQAIYKAVIATENLGAHTGATGNAVHGLGTMSTQNANAVNITGGNMSAVTSSNCNFNGGAIQGVNRLYPNAPPTLANGVAWDWAATPTQVAASAGIVIPQINNFQIGEHKRLFVYGGAITINQGSGPRIIYTSGSAYTAAGNVLSLIGLQWDAVLISISNFT